MTQPVKDSLVIHKQSPARVVSSQSEAEDEEQKNQEEITEVKVEIQLSSGKTKKVKQSTLTVLHPGPCLELANLEADLPDGNPAEVWELLQGEDSPTFSELTELIYGQYSPSSSWATFKLLNRSPWFRGIPEAIEINSADTVNSIIEEKNKKKENERRWTDFIERLQAGRVELDKDEIFLRDLEMYATGNSKTSRILKALGLSQNPENAHRFMLKQKIKPPHWNPHPLRLGIALDIPDNIPPNLETVPRKDLSRLEAFAIDDEGNQDPDDAISWDGSRLWVHVADAAGIVDIGSEMDELTAERASSLYLPETTVPMLPLAAIQKLGLGIQETSPALSYEIEINDQGEIVHCDIHLSTVKVRRLSYGEAEKHMDEEPFRSIVEVCGRFEARRIENGSKRIVMPEVKLQASAKDGSISIQPLPALTSREMVSECMVIAGTAAAHWCIERKIPIAFVRQESPQNAEQKAEQNAEQNAVASHSDPLPDYPRQYRLRNGMKRSTLSIHRAPHAALGLPVYTRVTSPLRRYADLIVSRQIRNTLLNRPIQNEEEIAHSIAASESCIGSLVQAERRSNLFWKMVWLTQHREWCGDAILLDVRENRGYFLIPELALETWVRIKQDLPVGQRAKLRCREVDLAESVAIFAVKEVLGDLQSG